MLGLWAIFASSLAAAAAAPQVAAVQTPAKVQPVRADARLETAAAAIDDGRYAAALEAVGNALSDQLSSSDADWAAYLKARALVGLGRGDDAEKVIRERYAASANGYTWASLVAILTARGRFEQAAQAILDLDEEEFIMVNRLRPAAIDSIVVALGEPQRALRERLIVRLVEGRYSGPASQRVPDGLRLRYISMLIQARRIEDAAHQTQALETPALLSIILTDRAFEPLWEHPSVRGLMAPGALVARVERGVQLQLEQAALTSTDWLNVMRSLRMIGKADEAVKLGLHAVQQARQEQRAAGPALRLEIASAYADIGEAWAARRTARALLQEEAQLSVVQRVAIAQILSETGDHDGALQLLATLDGSAKTPAVLKAVACAAHNLGRVQKRDEALAALESAKDQAPVDVFGAYVCTGQKEKAAALLAAMFAQPAFRADAVTLAQLYADPANPVSDQNDMRYRMKALVATAVVQDAIKPYARTMPLPFTIAYSRGS